MLCSISGTDWSGRLFSVLVVLVLVWTEYFWLSLSHESKRMQLLISWQLFFFCTFTVLWNVTSAFLVWVFPVISGSWSLCKLTQPLLSSLITFGCCCPDPEICGGKTTKSGPLLQIEMDAFVRLYCECCCKGCVVIMSIVQHAAVRSDAMFWNL